MITFTRGPVAPTRTPRRRRPFATRSADARSPGRVAVELDADEQPRPTHLPDDGMRSRNVAEARAEVGADALGLLGEPLALDHVEHRRADGGRDGRPAKVEKKCQRAANSAAIAGVVMTAPIGWPLPIGLPRVTMSGTTPSCAKPQNGVPTRPKPACTSSAMQSAPAARARS